MNTADAAPLRIETGEAIRVWNKRGSCELQAVVGDDVLPGVGYLRQVYGDGDTGNLILTR